MNSILYFTYPLGIIVVLVLVIGLGFFLTRKYNLGWRLYWIGAALFVIAQTLHIPFNILLDRLFRNGVLPVPPEQYQLLFNSILLGLSAALFEEVIRYAGFRWWAKDARIWSKGLLFGSGWSGIEAILFFCIPLLLNYFILTALRTQDLSALLSPEQLAPLQEGMNIFWSVPWYDSLLGAVERILVLPIQISLTIIVLQVFTRQQSRWLWIAIAWHLFLDAVTVYSVSTWGIYVTEALVAIFSITSVGIIFALRQEEPPELSPLEESNDQSIPQKIELPPLDANSDNIEQTRYTD